MPFNWIEITVEDLKFTFLPPCPTCVASLEPLSVAVDWRSSAWLAVRVYGFKDAAGNPLATNPAYLDFWPSEGSVFKQLQFQSRVNADTYATYAVDFQRNQPQETLTIDPTVRLYRGPSGIP